MFNKMVIIEMFSFSGININGKSPVSDACQCKDTTDNCINWENFLISLVIFDVCDQVRQKMPHFKVEISSVKNLSGAVSDQNACASLESRVFIHEVEEEHFFEWVSWNFGDGINFGNKVLMFEHVLSVPFNSVVERFRDGELVKFLHEFGKRNFEVFHYGSPSDLGWVIQVYTISFGHVCDYRFDSRDDSGCGEENNAHNDE